jgi:dipeptidyl aminopeptidase/acylaminoacyl peptidase
MTTDAPQWVTRYTAQRLLEARVAKGDRSRAVVGVLRPEAVTVGLWRVGEPAWRDTDVPIEDFEHMAWLSADGRVLFRLADDDGNEHGHVIRTPLDDGAAAPVDLTPGWAPYTMRGGDCSLDGSIVVFSPIDADGFRLVATAADGTGEPRVIYQNAAEAWYARASADGRYASLDTTDHNPGTRRYAVSVFDVASGERVAMLADGDGGSITATCFAPSIGDPRILVAANRGANGFCRPEIWNPLTGDLRALPVDAAHPDAEIVPLDWSADGRYVLIGTQVYAEQRLQVHDLETGETVDVDVPPGSFWSPAHHSMFGPDGCVLAQREDADTPLAVWRWQPGGPPEEILRSSDVPRGRKATSVTFPSADGTTVQAWLIRPDGPGPHPAVVSVHGGPHWYIADVYNPEAQAWVDEGFAFLDVNFRGSLGRGRAFMEQIWGDLGRLELDDVAAAHRWLVAEGIARTEQIFITGASYGGYLTLYALNRQPELWAGGFAIVASADWIAEYEDMSPALQAAVRQWWGGTPEELPELYRERSPVTYAADLRAPLVIVQALNDTRVPPRQMRDYLALLDSLGKDVTIRWIGGGHVIPPGDEFRAEMELFLATARRVLGSAVDPLPA